MIIEEIFATSEKDLHGTLKKTSGGYSLPRNLIQAPKGDQSLWTELVAGHVGTREGDKIILSNVRPSGFTRNFGK
jgi:hypothetical protein